MLMLVYSVLNKTTVIQKRMGVLCPRSKGSNWLDTRKFKEDKKGFRHLILSDFFFNCPVFAYLPFHKLMLRFCVGRLREGAIYHQPLDGDVVSSFEVNFLTQQLICTR